MEKLSRYFTRRLSASDASLFLDEFFLRNEITPELFTGGQIILSPSGEPMIRILYLESGESLFYFSTDFFKEPDNAIPQG